MYGAAGRGPGLALDQALRAELADRLRRSGDLEGAPDESVEGALAAFARRESLEARLRDDGRLDPLLLEVLRSRT
jgi:uncharacterized membrane protein